MILNKRLKAYAKKCILEDMELLSDGELKKFYAIYAKSKDQTLEEVIDGMSDEKINWAMTQLDNTVESQRLHKEAQTPFMSELQDLLRRKEVDARAEAPAEVIAEYLRSCLDHLGIFIRGRDYYRKRLSAGNTAKPKKGDGKTFR